MFVVFILTAALTRMNPPMWVDVEGRPRLTYPCPRCGREAPRDRYPLSTLDHLKWQMFTVVTVVNWCGHGLDSLVMLDAEEGWAQLRRGLRVSASARRNASDSRSCRTFLDAH